MRVIIFFNVFFFFLYHSVFAQEKTDFWSNQSGRELKLRISDNNRYLVYNDGKPFFWLGDTAWELFHRLNREEADRYLEDRAEKGFTVIQAVILAELEGVTIPNAYGNLPLVDKNPDKPVEEYFKHVDYIVDKAASLGMFIGMLPSWGYYWKTNPGNDIRIFTEENARKYGEYLGTRYHDKPIIWILGGDSNPENDEELAIIEALANGLRLNGKNSQLITFHPRGPGRSSDYFHHSSWLDFNMFQSSHAAKGFDNGIFAELDRRLKPAKPTIDGEPRYEQMVVGFYHQGAHPMNKFTNYDTRTAAYWSMLAGTCGFTYGNNNIWQMWSEGEKKIVGADIPWYEAINHPGAYEMTHMRKLFESQEWEKLEPAQYLIMDGPLNGPSKIRAAIASDKSFLMVYSPYGEPFTLNLDSLAHNHTIETWFDPRYGSSFVFRQGITLSVKTFTPPTSGVGNDWMLVVETKSTD